MSGRGADDLEAEALGFAAVPCLSELVDAVVRLVPFKREAAVAILDLGAGSGLLAEALLRSLANAHAVLMEHSAELRTAADKRLAAFTGRFELVPVAFAHEQLPRGFDLIVTLFGLHHLDDIARRGVYRGIYGALNPDGAFLAAEWIRPPTNGIASIYADIHTREGRVAGASKGVFLSVELPWLATIGFRDIDIHYKNLEYGVYGARRPPAGDYPIKVTDDRALPARKRRLF